MSKETAASPETQLIGRRFGQQQDYDNLRVTDKGDLYWRGRKIRPEGWTTAEKIALGGVVATACVGFFVFGLANLPAILKNLAWASCQTINSFC